MSPYVPFVVLWAVLALAVIGLIIYRRFVSASEDDMIHVSEAATSATSQQVTVSQKLDQIDKWGKTLTVVVVVYGIVLGGIYVYQSWVAGV
ncbi:MAG: hypothetical protein WB579_10775 [Bryobacteraceae bacterium]